MGAGLVATTTAEGCPAGTAPAGGAETACSADGAGATGGWGWPTAPGNGVAAAAATAALAAVPIVGSMTATTATGNVSCVVVGADSAELPGGLRAIVL